ncbi:MAG TPA: glycine--tRNA ligase subunit beta [Halanaerobiales bacterium]|nr:glycine--tRNA ligase subunit beta [Halanaerobiales bacterium]
MSNRSLLEIGTEEIPAKLVKDIYSNMKEKMSELLEENRIEYENIKVYGAPRRIAVEINGLSEFQKQEVNEIKGPPKNIAFDDEGDPTKAATGFAQSQNIEVDELEERDTERGIYLYAVVERERAETKELLKDLYKRLIKEVNLPITMRWSDHDLRFIRPIHWLVSLYNDETIKFELEHLTASNETWGHRFLANKSFEVNSVDEYQEVLKKAKVIVDPQERREIILEEIGTIILEKKLKFKLDNQLMDEVVHLVENPSPFLASFDEKYLELPEPVIVTPLKEHQKYFPLWDQNDDLSNRFIVVKEGGKEYIDNVREGNEKVLKARLEDAEFYYQRDIQEDLDQFLEDLNGLILREELGSMYDKTLRNVDLSEKIAANLNFAEDDIEKIKKAARYAKVDLVSQMVREFPELQGVMGSIYAYNNGMSNDVSLAIRDHYLPDSADSKLPGTELGKIVSLSDKIDTLTGFFGINLIPTGSQDPYGLRRAAIGIFRLIEDLNYEVEIEKLFRYSLEVFNQSQQVLKLEADELLNKIHEFMVDRIQYIFKDRGYDIDIIRTVIFGLPLSIPLIKKAIRLLDEVKYNKSFQEFLTAFNRVDSIIKDIDQKEVKPDLFEKEEEENLYNKYKEISTKVNKNLEQRELKQAYNHLIDIIDPIHDFFEEVRVMAEDERTQKNRLALLYNIQLLMKSLGDFTYKQ